MFYQPGKEDHGLPYDPFKGSSSSNFYSSPFKDPTTIHLHQSLSPFHPSPKPFPTNPRPRPASSLAPSAGYPPSPPPARPTWPPTRNSPT
ncbi:hypothetical protein HBI32_170970 [Parastagonospora nodorum]|nr:hypothetical protein HBI32_170970 [Parastagonospora nodorum]